jgi:hypothetical protein
LRVHRKDFEEIENLGVELGILNGTAHFEDYCDPSFGDKQDSLQPYTWEASK